jgi:hypothetical protein
VGLDALRKNGGGCGSQRQGNGGGSGPNSSEVVRSPAPGTNKMVSSGVEKGLGFFGGSRGQAERKGGEMGLSALLDRRLVQRMGKSEGEMGETVAREWVEGV